MLVADQQRADSLLVHGLRAVLRRGRGGLSRPESSLFAMAVTALEHDARHQGTVMAFPSSSPAPSAAGDSMSELLARYRRLPYEQRIALALTVVETFEVEDAARIARVPTGALARHQAAGLTALSAPA